MTGMTKIRITVKTGRVHNEFVVLAIGEEHDEPVTIGYLVKDDTTFQASDRWRIFPAHHGIILTTSASRREAVKFMANASLSQYFTGDAEVQYGGLKWQVSLPEKV